MTAKNPRNVKFTADSQMCKQDEIDVIENLGTAFAGTGCYLENFFRPAMINWVVDQIRNDFTADIMDHYGDTERQVLDLAGKYQQAKAQLEKVLSEQAASEMKASAALENMKKLFEAARSRESAENQRCCKAMDTIEQQDETIAGQQAEIIRLKAKLFDLMDK